MNLIYQKLFGLFSLSLDAEHAHDWACRCLSLTEQSNYRENSFKYFLSTNSSVINVFGLSFPNQLGLAAGMDKSGNFPKTISSLGFGHIEIGTITPKAQIWKPQTKTFPISKI